MTHRGFRRAALIAGTAVPMVVAGMSAPALAAPGNGQGRHQLHGSSPHWAKQAGPVGHVAENQQVSLRVYLAPNGGQQALDAAVAGVSTPGSASYHHYLTPGQYHAQFDPTSSEVSSVSSWLSGVGLRVTGVASGNRYLEAQGTASDAEQAFDTQLGVYHHQGKTVQAPESDLSVPDSVAGAVLGVTGLDTAPRVVTPAARAADQPAGYRNARPCSIYYGQLTADTEADHTTPLPSFDDQGNPPYAVCGYTPPQLRAAYGVDPSKTDGSGVTVAITDAYASPSIADDANTYATKNDTAPYASGQLTQVVPSDGYTHVSECGGSGWYGEETLDVEAVHAMAPAANIIYYASKSCYDSDFLDTLTTIVEQDKASIVTNSWGEPEEGETSGAVTAYEQVFKQGALEGIGFLFSSGDNGDELLNTGVVQSDYPTSDPWVTSVGGTSTAIGPDGSMTFETGWGTHKWTLTQKGAKKKSWTDQGFVYGAGGGFSSLFNKPSYQDGVVSSSYRGVPDVAMDADPTTGMLVGETQTFSDGTYYDEYRIGGTSLASPLMAGEVALAQQQAGTGKGNRIGFANPAIYQLAGTAFHDVLPVNKGEGNVRVDYANGENQDGGLLYSVRTFDQDSSLKVTSGWDDVTGVGSPNASFPALMAAAATTGGNSSGSNGNGHGHGPGNH